MSNVIKKESNKKSNKNINNNKEIKSKKIYENKMINIDNKENIQDQLFIKVNKINYYDNIKSKLDINNNRFMIYS